MQGAAGDAFFFVGFSPPQNGHILGGIKSLIKIIEKKRIWALKY